MAVPAASTTPVARLVAVSWWPASSVKLTRTLMRCPNCATASVYVLLVALEIDASSANHWYVKVAFSTPSGSPIPPMTAVSVSPTRYRPVIRGLPVGAAPARTATVCALVIVSVKPLSSAKVSRTLRRFPTSAPFTAYVAPAAPAIATLSASHW